jgi:NADH:ubiquinone oxidoreductase subunit 3 (subunit A)
MGELELGFFVVTLFLGFFFLVYLLVTLFERVLSFFLLQRSWAVRLHPRGVRLFECAALSRLSSQVSYSPQALGSVAAYVLYDLDLFFFVPALTQLGSGSLQQVGFFYAYCACFCLALGFDRLLRGAM